MNIYDIQSIYCPFWGARLIAGVEGSGGWSPNIERVLHTEKKERKKEMDMNLIKKNGLYEK